MRRRDLICGAAAMAAERCARAAGLGAGRVSYLNDHLRGRAMGRLACEGLPRNGLVQWLRPESLSGNEGDPISMWADSSGNGNHVTQTDASRPTLRKNAFFNYTAARMSDAAGQFFFQPNLAIDRQNHAVFMIVRRRGYTYNSFEVLLSAPAPYYILYAPNSNPGNASRTRLSGNVAGASYDVNQAIPCGPALIGVTGSATESRWIVNRDVSLQAQFAAGTSTLARIGANIQPGWGYYNGDLFEVAIYNRSLSGDEIAQVQKYFEARYGSEGDEALIVCDGNSISAGHMTEVPYSWPNIVQSRFLYRHRWINEAVPSIDTPALAAQAPSVIDPHLAGGQYRKRIVVFWEITNHVALGGADAQAAYEAVRTYCTARRAAGWEVVVATMLPRQNSALFETTRLAVNSTIRSNWTDFADALADVGADSRLASAADATLNAEYYADQIHLTRRGQEIAADYFYQAIRQVV